ncbi:cytochrome P450 4d2-like [Galleria mellonella]|uniref:Cytochrome P450 4d2-like n=1 Tax=Galleria mellonella TaxID=7137 RepID=A0ABM3MJN8_GALME|nr:cytochrome P450 4d2-like [Galleria mellonella]
MITLILLFTVLFVIFVSWINLLIDRHKLKLKGPFPLPILGNAHLFMGSGEEFLKLFVYYTKKFGDVLSIYLLTKRYIVVVDPKTIEHILSSTELISKGRSYEYLKPWLGEGLLTANGDRWKTHRKFLTPTLHFNILQNFLPVFFKNERILRKKLGKIADGSDIDLFPLVALAALDNVTESIMGVPVNAQTDTESKYVKAIERVSQIVAVRMRNALAGIEATFRLLSMKREQDSGLKILHGQSNSVIETRRNELKKLNTNRLSDASEFGIKNKHAFLDLLLLAEVNGKPIKDEHVREEVDTFMFEGHDTTTSGIVFCLYNISNRDDVQQKLFDEQKQIFGDDLERDPTYSELQQMKYLEMVIKESLRLYPSVPLIERLITRDTEIDGLKIPANTALLIDIFHMHRHPDLYEDPDEFKPERFDPSIPRSAFSWLPFSAGPRNCIGQKFAILEMKITLAGIIKHFKLLPSNIEPKLTPDLILRSTNGVKVKFMPRT